jgi:pilus assembly protein Flp/PilA
MRPNSSPAPAGLFFAPRIIRKLLRDEAGTTAIEYGLIAALVAVVTIAGLTTILNSRCNAIATDIGS